MRVSANTGGWIGRRRRIEHLAASVLLICICSYAFCEEYEVFHDGHVSSVTAYCLDGCTFDRWEVYKRETGAGFPPWIKIDTVATNPIVTNPSSIHLTFGWLYGI